MSTGFNQQLADELGMHRGLVGGGQVPINRMDFNFADAGMGGPFSSPLAPMIIQPMINAMFGHGGVMPAQFAPQQGLYDQYRAKSFWQAHNAAMTTAAQADRETYVAMIRGIANMKQTPWDITAQRSANIMAGDMAAMSPFFAQASPEMFDLAHGTRGSATVMASFLHRGGLMGVDPVTGRTGISGASSGVLAAEMHRRFFGQDADLAGWRGISAGRAGAMYDELQTRGLMGTSIGAMSPAEQLRALTGSATSRSDVLQMLKAQSPEKFGNVSGGDLPGLLKGLQAEGSSQFETILRQFDANQIGNRLKSMSGAVAAMREIFGDIGRPNAPMSQLMEGLNALTQGGLATMNPAEMERTVRSAQVIARTSGMGLQALQGLTVQSSAMAQTMGLDPRFGMIAAQGSAEFGAAYGQVGRGDVGGWGRLDRDKLQLIDAQLRLNAANSPMANRVGALMRMVETQEGAQVPLSGPLVAVAEAVRAHRSSFINERGQEETLNMNDARFRQIAALSNFAPAATEAFLRSQAATQEQIAKYGITDIVQQRQPDELRMMMSQRLHESVMGQLNAGGVTGERAANIARVAARAQAVALTDMPVDIRVNDATRNQALMDATRAAVVASGVSEAEFDQMFPKGQFAAMVAGGTSRVNEQLARDPRWRGLGGSLNAVLDQFNPEVRRRQAVVHRDNQAEVALGSALSGLAMAGPIARLMDEVQKPSATFGAAVKHALGGIDPSVVRTAVANIDPDALNKDTPGAGQRLSLILEELMGTLKEYDTNETVAQTDEQKQARREALTKRIASLRSGGGAAGAEIRSELQSLGLVKQDDSDAKVREVALQVRSGTIVVDEKVQHRVGALIAAGGASDAASIQRQKMAILSVAGITKADDISKIMGGNLDQLKGTHRENFQTLMRMGAGLDVLAPEHGIHVGAKIGAKEMADIATQREMLAAAVSTALPKGGPELAVALAERRRLAEGAIGGGRAGISALLGDAKAMHNLGKGGVALVTSAHDQYALMANIAQGAGLNMTDVMAGIGLDKLSPEQQIAADQIRSLNVRIGDTHTQIGSLMKSKKGEMTKAEEEALVAKQATLTQSDDDRSTSVIKSLVGGRSDEAGMTAAKALMGKGAAGDYDVYALRKMAAARKELDKLSSVFGGATMQELRESHAAPGLFAEAGEFGATERVDTGTVGRALGQIHTKAAAMAEGQSKTAAGAVAPGKLALSGEVTIRGDKLNFTGASGMGSTPVVT